MEKTIAPSIFFLIGGGLYCLLEIVWRGQSHWTMFIIGGLCFLILYQINDKLKNKCPMLLRCLAGATMITIVEFISGCIFNLRLSWNIWDYSDTPFNLLGQICLQYCLLWFLLTLPVILFGDRLMFIIKKFLRRFTIH